MYVKARLCNFKPFLAWIMQWGISKKDMKSQKLRFFGFSFDTTDINLKVSYGNNFFNVNQI